MENDEMSVRLKELLLASAAAHTRFAGSDLRATAAAARAMAAALHRQGTILAFGNGGSAGDAQHFAAELGGRFEKERQGLPSVALTADSSIITAIANDYGFETLFERQIEALGRNGDVALGISTSGQSRNVERGLLAARKRGLMTIALTGRDGGVVGRAVDVHINVPEQSTARVQEVHRTILHCWCALIDESR